METGLFGFVLKKEIYHLLLSMKKRFFPAKPFWEYLGGGGRKRFICNKTDPIRGVCLAFFLLFTWKQDVSKWITGLAFTEYIWKKTILNKGIKVFSLKPANPMYVWFFYFKWIVFKTHMNKLVLELILISILLIYVGKF